MAATWTLIDDLYKGFFYDWALWAFTKGLFAVWPLNLSSPLVLALTTASTAYLTRASVQTFKQDAVAQSQYLNFTKATADYNDYHTLIIFDFHQNPYLKNLN